MTTKISISYPSTPQRLAICKDRFQKVSNFAIKVIKSPLFWSSLIIGSLIGYSFLFLSTNILYSLWMIGIMTIGSISYILPKDFIYEIAVTHSLVLNILNETKWPWYNKIKDHIYLGALPLESRNHLQDILKKNNISVVLSLNESFELTKQTFFSTTISEKTYRQNKIERKKITCVDMTALSNEKLNLAADFIHKRVKQKKNILVHCKSGMGRSACAVAAYLIKFEKYTPEQALAYIQKKRPVMFLTKEQLQSIKSFKP